MTDVSLLSATPVLSVPVLEKTGKGRDLIYLVAFAAVGLVVSTLSLALTRAEWVPETAMAMALASAG